MRPHCEDAAAHERTRPRPRLTSRLTDGTQVAAVSHALLLLVRARNPNGARGRQIDDESVQGRGGDILDDASRWLPGLSGARRL
jgi:hypothetical protein